MTDILTRGAKALAKQQSYTPREIEDLREACQNKVLNGRYSGPSSGRVRISKAELDERTEKMVRTFMANGTKARDLIKGGQ